MQPHQVECCASTFVYQLIGARIDRKCISAQHVLVLVLCPSRIFRVFHVFLIHTNSTYNAEENSFKFQSAVLQSDTNQFSKCMQLSCSFPWIVCLSLFIHIYIHSVSINISYRQKQTINDEVFFSFMLKDEEHAVDKSGIIARKCGLHVYVADE